MYKKSIYDVNFVFTYLNKNYNIGEYQDFIGLFEIHNDLTFKYGAELLVEINKIFNITKEDSILIINQWVASMDATIVLDKYWNHKRPIKELIDRVVAFQTCLLTTVLIKPDEINKNGRIFSKESIDNMIDKYNKNGPKNI